MLKRVICMNLFSFRDPAFYISHNLDPIPNAFEMHTHTFAELYCFLSGKGIYHVEGSAYALQPGDILLMRPAEAHYIEVDPSLPYERICLNFDIRLFDTLEPGNRLMEPFFARPAGIRNHYTADDTATSLLRSMLNPEGSRATIIACLILLLQHLGARFGAVALPAAEPNTVEYRMIRYINQNLHRELTIQKLCDHFYMSRAQLCRRFEAATGTSVGKYIATKRLIQARELIRHGQKPTQVFSACGYRDYATFYRAYKTNFGYSPSQAIPIEPPEAHVFF